MTTPLQKFQEALLVRRVVARHLDRVAMEHPTEEAKKTYLKDHPNADPSNHTVKKNEGGGGKGGDVSGDAAKASARSKETTKNFEEMKDLKKKVDNADPSAKKKFDKAYDKLYEGGESAAKSAEKLLKKFDNVEGKEAQSASFCSTAPSRIGSATRSTTTGTVVGWRAPRCNKPNNRGPTPSRSTTRSRCSARRSRGTSTER